MGATCSDSKTKLLVDTYGISGGIRTNPSSDWKDQKRSAKHPCIAHFFFSIGIPTTKKLSFETAWKQICIYAFPKPLLKIFAKRKTKTPLEKLEDIEILRFLEMGYDIRMIELSGSSFAIDTPEDLEKVRNHLRDNQQ